jgi:hypothetical protein
VTCTSPFGVLLELEALVRAGLVAGDGAAGVVVFPPQELRAIISPIKTYKRIAFFVFAVFRTTFSPGMTPDFELLRLASKPLDVSTVAKVSNMEKKVNNVFVAPDEEFAFRVQPLGCYYRRKLKLEL